MKERLLKAILFKFALHQENSTLLEGLELASLAILAEPSSPARELGLTRHSLFARGKIH